MIEPKTGMVLTSRYRLIDKIGRGGMAEVWSAKDNTLGRTVAVKIMLPQFAIDQNFARRFKREAAAAANLQNPHIVNVYDWGHDDDIQYMVMEYIPGQDMRSFIDEKGGRLSCKESAEIGSQVCQALASAHHQDIIHRDIKPQNIMIQPDGNVKVMDFGIARAKNSTDQKTEMVLGTAHYVSPEQAQGMELTAASDLYSLGIVLYEATTGKLPFDGDDAVSIALKQVEEEPLPMHEIADDIDPEFERIVMRALEKDPDDRYQTAIEMGRALKGYASGIGSPDAETVVLPRNASSQTTSPDDGTRLMQKDATGTNDPDNMDSEDDSKKRRRTIGIVAACAIAALVIIIALVSSMTAPVKVPEVSGTTLDQAISQLEESGLDVGEQTEVPSADIPAGSVVDTDPDAGEDVARGTKVNIEVSSGPQQVKVPDLSNKSEKEALEALEEAGLTGERGESEYSSTVEEGDVISQNPASGATVDAGSSVTYILSAGADTVSVPDLSGKTEDEAMSLLSENGLRGLVGSEQPSDTVEKGKVISQNPSRGIKVESGSQVTFTVSSGVADEKVPTLTGMSQSMARSVLSNSGLSLGKVDEEYSDTVASGTVISQSIKGGDSVKKGSSVDIVVSKGKDPSKAQQQNQNNSEQSSSQSSNDDDGDDED